MREKIKVLEYHTHMSSVDIDVNIHPAKLEVKFVNEKAIFETVFYAVRNALSRATSGSNLYFGGVSEDVPIDKIVKTFPPDKYKANDADSAHEDNGNKDRGADKNELFPFPFPPEGFQGQRTAFGRITGASCFIW